MDQSKVDEILKSHTRWLKDPTKGKQANFAECWIKEVDFVGKSLSEVNFNGSVLRKCRFFKCDLTQSTFFRSDLAESSFHKCSMPRTNFTNSSLDDISFLSNYLCGSSFLGTGIRTVRFDKCDLTNANFMNSYCQSSFFLRSILISTVFSQAMIDSVIFNSIEMNYTTIGLSLTCPSKGSFIGYKKCFFYGGGSAIVKLLIPEDALRSSRTSRKCRCSKAKVLSITKVDNEEESLCRAWSIHDPSFEYTVGKEVEVKDFDTNRWNECSAGIHFFMTREEAESF